MFNARVVCHSIDQTGQEVCSILARYPRSILAEFNTHTIISKNTSSSRAIPYAREKPRLDWQPYTMREMVLERPYIPVYFGFNKPGMQPGDEMTEVQRDLSIKQILKMRDEAVAGADVLWAYGMHKGDVNRYIEPYSWTEQLLTATQWANFFHLRTPEPPHPAMKRIARMMYLAYHRSKPKLLKQGEWHLPFIDDEDRASWPVEELLEMSVARCARLTNYSFTTGKKDRDRDFKLFDDLRTQGHWSPFGHQCTPAKPGDKPSNLKGMLQYRKLFPNECADTFTVPEETLLVWQAEIERPIYGEKYYV